MQVRKASARIDSGWDWRPNGECYFTFALVATGGGYSAGHSAQAEIRAERTASRAKLRLEPLALLRRQPYLCGGPQPLQRSDLQSADVCGDTLPTPVAMLPVVRVSACALSTVRFLVAGARVDDRKVAKDADHDVMLTNILY
jgi:hypothetical protein